MMSPEKTNKGKERFIRNGLAARATALYDRTHASMSLWDADLSLSLANSASSSRRGLDPDLRLRILHILHIPSPVSNPSSNISIPGVALCHLLTSPPPLDHPSSVHSLSKGGIHAVLFSFSSLAPPRLHALAQLCIRNPEDFAEGQEVYVWKPWQLLPMDTDALRRSIATSVDTDAAEEAAAAVDVFDLFGSGPSKAQCRDHVSQTALVCERFVILK
ncbi:hypothetical protein R3P38DRAFT_3326418 [Favolaschia claudopus]|uniref:Uncharacterized protein n=1 Tax=Favolaschia claudopus TaxID=2862362 RepID=A0AAW0AAH3_9AGAR